MKMDDDSIEPETQTTITKGPSGHSQILHVRQDSAHELELMFSAAMNPNHKSKSLPMKLRKLPKSFFQEPDRPRHLASHAHSRSMGGLVSTPVNPINHSRSSSNDSSASHASGVNLSSNNLHQQASMHNNPNVNQRQGNFNASPNQHPMFNAQNHMGLQVPQVAHSRSKSSPASLQMMQKQQNAIEIPPDMPFPPGWEVAKTPEGQMYFMNHSNQTTTWIDPRITLIKEQQQQQELNNPGNLQSGQNHQQNPMHIHQNDSVMQSSNLPSGWEQATTSQGEVYFINHKTKTTSWRDPRLDMNMHGGTQSQINAQLQQQMHKINQLELQPQFNRSLSGSQMMIKQLAKEKEIMMKRQEALKQQVTTTGMDPFLGSGTPYHDRDHNRKGMGGGFGFPRSSDDYLGGAEEMETDSGPNPQVMNQQGHMAAMRQQSHPGHVQHPHQHSGNQQQNFSDFLDSLPASNVDFGGDVNNQGTHALNEDELVPSINETLSPDFINDVESMLNPVVKSENMENMTWL